MTREELEIPTYEDIGRQLVEGVDFDSLDFWEAVDEAEEAGHLRLSEEDLEGLSERELSTLFILSKLRSGKGLISKLSGIVIKVEPASPGETDYYLGSRPPDSDDGPSGDREPRNPIQPDISGNQEQELTSQS